MARGMSFVLDELLESATWLMLTRSKNIYAMRKVCTVCLIPFLHLHKAQLGDLTISMPIYLPNFSP